MNEKQIQNHLFPWLENRKQTLITPNVRLYGKLESDLISVSRAKLITEFEIKCTVYDFNRDFQVKRKKHLRLSSGNSFSGSIPNYFWFAFNHRLFKRIETLDVPEYAGIVVVEKSGQVKEIKRPKRLHCRPATERDLNYLYRGLMYRFWNYRLEA